MHHSENQVEVEAVHEVERRTRIGVRMLLGFAAIYFAFIALCAFANQWFAAVSLAGVPGPVVYGMGLILLALIVAGVYGRLCRTV